jgi:hypothetical protein
VTKFIVEKLHHHPLSLANIGISIRSSQASDPSHWKMIEEDLKTCLEAVGISKAGPVLHGRPYSFSVRSSMMVMVTGLRPEAFPLLGIMALFSSPYFPEETVKLFYGRISQINIQFALYLKYLEARSLIKIWEQEKTVEFMVSMDGSRTQYIRETRSKELRALALHVLGVTNRQEESMQSKEEGT